MNAGSEREVSGRYLPKINPFGFMSFIIPLLVDIICVQRKLVACLPSCYRFLKYEVLQIYISIYFNFYVSLVLAFSLRFLQFWMRRNQREIWLYTEIQMEDNECKNGYRVCGMFIC